MMQRLRKIVMGWLVSISVVIVLSGLLVIGFPITLFNNLRLQRFSEHVFNYPLPAETIVISEEARFGLIFGNGNHCDYWARRSLETASSKEVVLAHYRQVTFPEASANSPYAMNGRIPVEVNFSDEEPNGKIRYSIDVIDEGYLAGLDPRCH